MDAVKGLNDPSNKVTALVERNILPQGISLIDPAAVAKSSRQDFIVIEIEKADNCIKANACNKLQVIAELIRLSQKQVESILLEAERNGKLHHVACNFIKQPGHIYHLYQRDSGQFYFSMLSPEEWGNSAPSQSYKGSFQLGHDRSWTRISELQAKDNELNLFKNLLSSNKITNTLSRTVMITGCPTILFYQP